ncbi:DgyrCDS13273 [Dimorphilus gyrociliatus]|nr:DgyrCDS13273 [Dimorphilus gyrociliatus]
MHKQKVNTKKLATVTKEKEQAQAEHGKAVLAKGQLEGLCRELQRRCKEAKEETLHEVRSEEEKRKKIVDTFQTTINEIQGQINGHQETNIKLREENIKLAEQLKSLINQYEEREKHIEEILKHRELEKQLSDAKNAQILLQLAQEQENKRKILEELENNLRRIALMEEHEKQLKAQIKMYTEKYEEFQGTLTNSNEVLKAFKAEMDAMTKRMRKMEKDAVSWKTRWENSNKTLIQMAEEKTRQDKEALLSQSRINKLESLCRALQAERYKLAKKDQVPKEEVTEEAKKDNEENEEQTSESLEPPNSENNSKNDENDDNKENEEETGKEKEETPKPVEDENVHTEQN